MHKVKHNWDESIQRNETGHVQETFAHVANLDIIRALISLATKKGWKLFQLKLKLAFLNGELKEEVYIEQPQGLVIKSQGKKVYKA